MQLGLFPLNTIVFPLSAIPLHIFEERYKLLINECWKTKSPFVINLSYNEKLYDIGCMVLIADIMQKYEDGRMDILVVGTHRVKIKNFISGEKPYYLANVEILSDINNSIDSEKLKNVVEMFNNITNKLKNPEIKPIIFEELNKENPSFQIAPKAGLTIEQKQKLMEIRSENERLNFLEKHLGVIDKIIDEAEIVNTIIKNDGYFNVPPQNL
ncbi:MAG: LON peptidase substrate-binding domain-containing protein [Bacteroidota bacterium]